MSDHLHPCPWCGQPPTIGASKHGVSVVCVECRAAGPERPTRIEAEDAWNAVMPPAPEAPAVLPGQVALFDT